MSFYESPIFIDILLVIMYVLAAAAIGITAWSMFHSVHMRNRESVIQGIPAGKIAWGVAILLSTILIITGLLADTSAIVINGKTFSDTLWLRVSDMLINTSIILIIIAIIGVAAGSMSLGRKISKKEKSHK